ncbi:hypothetical protein [Faecalimicrobium sp. JNUCC 81]
MNLLSSRIFKRKNRNKNIKKRSLSAFLAFVMMLGVIPLQVYSATDGSSEIKLEDENLKIAVQEEIKKVNPDYTKNTITNKDMELLTELNLSNKGIQNLSGIENAINLESINLEGNEITDISMLGSLSKLAKYNISKQSINLDLGNIDKTEVEFENMLVNIDRSKIISLFGEDVSLKEGKIVLSNLINGQNKKTVKFNASTEKGEFSGMLDVIISSELKEKNKEDSIDSKNENSNEVEGYQSKAEHEDKKHLNTTRAALQPNINANIDLKDQFIISAWGGSNNNGTSVSPDQIDNSSIIGNSIEKNYIKATDSGLGQYQNTSITSKYKIDFSRSFKMLGKINLAGFNYSDGIAFAFHNQEGYKFGGGYSSNLGIYNHNGTGLKEKALVLEADAWGNRDTIRPDLGDFGKTNEDVHLGINRILPGNNPQVISEKLLDKNIDLFKGIQEYEIAWDAVNKTIKLKFANHEVSTKIQNIEDIIGGQEAYYTIGASAGTYLEHDPTDLKTEVVYDLFQYTDFKLKQDTEYYKVIDGNEILLTDSDNIEEEDTVIVRQKYQNIKSDTAYNMKLNLINNDFRGQRLSVESGNESKWYKAYIIQDSFKSYVGTNKIDDNSIDEKDFFVGNKVDIEIPENKDIRIVEYKVKIPKVVGESNEEIKTSTQVGADGMSYDINSYSKRVMGTKSITIEDSNLTIGLTDNIKGEIVENRPVDFEGRVYGKELRELDIVNLNNLGISNIGGLENCINAVEINLSSNNDITDVSILNKITSLKSLNLSNNTKVAKESLEQLFNIDTLIMDSANIDDEYSKAIGKLLKLKKISLKNNNISDLNNLSSLDKLNEFYFDNNKIYDLRPIKDQIENAKLNANKYSIKKQVVNIERPYINSGEFIFDNIIYNSEAIENNISGADDYDFANNRVKWVNLPDGIQDISYNWMNNQFMFSGTVNIELNQVPGPDYLVVIPASLKMGDVLDENSVDYDEETDKTSINYKPDKDVIKPNPTVYGMAGAKDIISISSDDTIIGNVNIYSDSVFTMTNTNNSKDMALVDVYKTFNDKLSGTASSKKDKLMSLNNTNRKDTFRIKAPTSRFKYNNVEYTGTMNFIIEHVK